MARTTFAQNGLVRLGYEVQGDSGPIVMLLHGLLADRASVRPVMDEMEDEATFITMDLRGHGGSSAIHGVDLSIRELVGDAFAVLDAAEATKPVIVMGVELGAIIAQRMLAERPELIAGSVLVNYPSAELRVAETLEEIATLAYREQVEQAMNRWLDLSWGEGWKESVPKPRIAAARRSAGAIHPVLTALANTDLQDQESILLAGTPPFESEENVSIVVEQIRSRISAD